MYAQYAPEFPCLANGLVRSTGTIGQTFGGLQPGLHITLEVTKDNGGYVPGDEPQYRDNGGPTCYGLTGPPIRPFPYYRDGLDGYRDGQPVNPSTGRSSGPPPTGPNSPCTYPDQRRPGCSGAAGSSPAGRPAAATPFAPASYDRTAVDLAAAAVLGTAPNRVPDVAVLLFAPMARGTTVRVG